MQLHYFIVLFLCLVIVSGLASPVNEVQNETDIMDRKKPKHGKSRGGKVTIVKAGDNSNISIGGGRHHHHKGGKGGKGNKGDKGDKDKGDTGDAGTGEPAPADSTGGGADSTKPADSGAAAGDDAAAPAAGA